MAFYSTKKYVNIKFLLIYIYINKNIWYNLKKGEKVIQMNKKILIITLIIAVFIMLAGILIFIPIGKEIRNYIQYKITTPKESVTIEEQEKIKITYAYGWTEECFDIDVTDKEIIKMIKDNISNNKLENYSGQINLLIWGEYNVDLGSGISFKFDGDDGFVMMNNGKKNFLTKINPEILRKITEIVDIKLTENIEMFKTNKITISQKDETCTVVTDIEEKTAIEYILNQCKNIYIKEINYEPTIVAPDYEINFNNNVKLYIYKQKMQGWILKDGILSEAYGLNVFETILENSFNNIAQKKEMFTTNKITITDSNKSIEITDKETIEKITTPIIYSNMQEKDWLENYDIAEEYNNGIKIKINSYEFLIPGKKGSVTIGNRYIISEDRKKSLCFPLQNIEEYVNELLGNKTEK